MRLPQHPQFRLGLAAALACLVLGAALFLWPSSSAVRAQNRQDRAQPKPSASTSTNTAAPSTNAAPASAQPATAPTNAPAPALSKAAPGALNAEAAPKAASEPASGDVAAKPAPAATGGPAPGQPPGQGKPEAAAMGAMAAAAEADKVPATGEIPLSLQAANVDMVVQWLAKTTGKSVVKHPKVQCQLTIVSSKDLPVREAVNLVYRALALEGFSTIETSKSIIITPEGQEPKTSPELVDTPSGALPEGRQRLIKIFHLDHVSPAEIK